MYMASFNSTIDRYRELLSEQSAGRLKLPNDNLMLGTFTTAGQYKLMDTAYSRLLHKLQGHYTEVPQELRSDILAFYRDLSVPFSTKTDANDWAQVLNELGQLQAVDVDLPASCGGYRCGGAASEMSAARLIGRSLSGRRICSNTGGASGIGARGTSPASPLR